MRLVVVGPHVEPDTAPTGVVLSRLVAELASRGHEIHVVAALPWYRNHRLEPGWGGRPWRREITPWGSIRRVHPFPGDDKTNLIRRAVGFVGFSALALLAGLRAGGLGRRVDGVVAMSPPLTLGLTGRLIAWSHRAPLVFNVQDVFPDAAERTGAVTNPLVLRAARLLERLTYRRSDAITVLSDDLVANLRSKVSPEVASRIHMIPNFVDTEAITPSQTATRYRSELGIGDEPVVMYAGNLGWSQPFEMLIDTARRRPEYTIVINGDGAAAAEIDAAAATLPNLMRVGYQPSERLGEVLASADIHVVILKAGLAAVSVPSKTYSVMASARPVVASIDPGTAIPRMLEVAGAGLHVAPGDVDAFVAALDEILQTPDRGAEMGRRGRDHVVATASPAAVAQAYEDLLADLGAMRSRSRRPSEGASEGSTR
jgi:colanic acid biosynthesis glycosyl transferase WcaI